MDNVWSKYHPEKDKPTASEIKRQFNFFQSSLRPAEKGKTKIGDAGTGESDREEAENVDRD